ncbi:DUF411 domain-containing protein [Gloeothece verrucosa]|uniref:Metal-binding protein n=1 Tax=Gloeothece verrucosa (strain PCC 7822) TaxID=497965 RepID=E0UIQ8_GLOV7|nr:DUF411 domain-containing protein [Gloeothece verrucosa]ADN13367.1 protein of unknown function DUF411 [Gloeothece verrucosa PCC 7822]
MKLKKILLLLIFLPILIMAFSPAAWAENQSIWEQKTPLLEKNSIVVYSDPSCGCCEGWIKHLNKQGFKVTNIKTPNVFSIKEKYQVPEQLASCHTALIDGYVIEGHVPAKDIKRLVLNKSELQGLSVPQMPVGTPGMEMGNRKDPFSVVGFEKNGKTSIFETYQSY